MLYYLHHYFDPDFDYQNLKPKVSEQGRADHYNLDYVQNVISGQVLAEWREISEEEASKYDTRFVSDKKTWPLGPNVGINPQNKNQIIAKANGYVFYYDGKIAVKTVLNVRRDVDFHTGNIYFVGDMIIHGSVRSGFEVKANNIRIKGNVEAAKIFVGGSLVVEGGIKGGGNAFVDAKENIKVNFCEKASLRAGKKILITGSALHSHLFGKEYIVVHGRLQGGMAVSERLIYAEKQIGGGMGCKTELILGYDSDLMKENFELELRLGKLSKQMSILKVKVEKGKEYQKEYESKLKKIEKNISILRNHRLKIHEKMKTEFYKKAKAICPGQIRPGVEISIGPYYYRVDDFLENGKFEITDDEIVFKQPAIQK
ncbi:FapA family protein [Desulfonauticus submarinus]